MVKVFASKPMVCCLAAGLVAALVSGCGSSSAKAPPGQPVAQAVQTPPPMAMPGAGAQMGHGAHGGSAPGGPPAGHGSSNQPMVSNSPMGHGQHGQHGQMPGSSQNSDPAKMMHGQHGQPGPHGQAPGGPSTTDPAMTMKTPHGQHGQHGQGSGAPTMPDPSTTMKTPHGQTPGTPGSSDPAMAHGPGAPNTSDPGAMKAHGGSAPGGPAGSGPLAGGPMANNPGGSGGPGGGQIPKFPEGSAEEALLKFCLAMADNNLTAAAEYISPKAKGLLAEIRDGNISDDKLDGMKPSMMLDGMQLKSSRQVGSEKRITLGNKQDETLSFSLFKESDVYKLREFKITAGKPGNNNRQQGYNR